MTNIDPYNPRPQRPPDIDPLPTMPPGSNPPRYQDVDHTDPGNAGTIVAAVLAGLVVIAVLIVWASGTSDHQTASNPRAQTTGQNTK
jgi:hypothetical protein